MYGIDKNITFNQKTVEIQTSMNSPKELVNISENILVEDIRSIYDVACSAKIVNKTSLGISTNYEGEVCLDIYFDTGNNLSVKKAKIPLMVKMDCDTDDITIHFVNKHFKLINEDVVCDIDIEVIPNVASNKKINLIQDVEEEECEDDCDYAMVVYFVKDGDTIWNIARDFKVTMESIMKANNLEENQRINVGEKLYIMK